VCRSLFTSPLIHEFKIKCKLKLKHKFKLKFKELELATTAHTAYNLHF
jgi:hypothetical protein